MRLYLVQHGEAKPKEEDPDRPLTDRGRAEVAAAARFLAASGDARVPRIQHSGKTRARETAELLGTALAPAQGVSAADGLAPLDHPGVWAQQLATRADDVMLVGHLPHLSTLAALLVAGDAEREIVRFQYGGVLCLERDASGAWRVRWMLVPALLA